MLPRSLFAALTLSALAIPCTAQVPTPTGGTTPAAAPADVASIDAIITAVYDVISGPAGQARDWDRFRSLFLSDAKLIPILPQRGGAAWQVRYMTVEDFVANGRGMEERGFFESEVARVAEQFEHMAHAFSTYESRWTPEGEVFQRGINSFQLLFDGERWWIVNIMWQGVGPEFEIPARYLGQEQR